MSPAAATTAAQISPCDAVTMPDAKSHAENHDRVRKSYDAVAEEYRDRIGGELAHKPLDRALLAAVVEQTERGAPIAELGCGPGHGAGRLARRGARAGGIGLSPALVAIDRRGRPAAAV